METVIIGPWPFIHIGTMVLPTYYVVISLVLLLTTWYVYKRAEHKNYSGTTALDLYLIALIAGVIGARLLHVLYEEPAYYWADPKQIFYFWQGGFVFYGGAIFAFLAGVIALRIKKQSLPLWLDFFTPVASIGYALGRIACFLTGCCYGRECAWPWAYPFATIAPKLGIATISYRHPTQLYASGLELILFAAILWIEKKNLKWKPGNLFCFWVFFHAINRMIVETFRDDDRGPLINGFSISFRISAFILIGLYLYRRNQRLRNRVP